MSAAVITYERIECTLRDGTLVLGKEYQGETFPKTYANRTQAERAAQKEAGEVIQRGRPFYVRLLPAPRFANVSCSQCGSDFGPGEHGFSHCEHHQRRTA
jgi:hypothetical protein